MSTNITAAHQAAFSALSSGKCGNFALFSCFVNGEPAAAIVAINRDGDSLQRHPSLCERHSRHDARPITTAGSRKISLPPPRAKRPFSQNCSAEGPAASRRPGFRRCNSAPNNQWRKTMELQHIELSKLKLSPTERAQARRGGRPWRADCQHPQPWRHPAPAGAAELRRLRSRRGAAPPACLSGHRGGNRQGRTRPVRGAGVRR